MGTFWAVWVSLAGGAAYGAIVGYAKHSAIDGVTAGGVAFLCLFAVLCVFLRKASKAMPTASSSDMPTAQPVPEIGDDFVSIRSGIEELKAQGALPEIVPEKPTDGQRPLFRNLAQTPAKRAPVEALAPKQLLELKMPYQAVLNAAVNFEREVRHRAGIPGGRAVSLTSLFTEPKFNLSREKIQQLETLRRVRNGILHGFETLVDPVEAAQLVAAFDSAASWFDVAKDAKVTS
jgi:hypothetical protein